MNVLMVSPFPPIPDGIAAYAVQSVAELRRLGHQVQVLSPQPSAAHGHLPLPGVRGALELRRRVIGFDRLVVQFHPDIFFPQPSTPASRTAVAVALAAAFAQATECEVVVHEVDYAWGAGASPAALAVRMMWRRADRVVVHSETERQRFVRAFGVPADRVRVIAHGQDFAPRTTLNRDEARWSLNIEADVRLFLAIGFVQPHKGFDRAIHAFRGLDQLGCRLAVVGSVRVEEPAFQLHAAELERLAEATPGVDLHLGWVSDERFDRWLAAADVVVLPYREIWSSGVLERARLFEVDVVVTDVGGLAEQVAGAPRMHVVPDDDDELRRALCRLAGAGTSLARRGDWDDERHWTSAEVQAEVTRRAVSRRGSVPASPRTGGRAPTAVAAARPLRQLPLLTAPVPVSSRPASLLVKRVVRTLTGWQVDQLVAYVNALRAATTAAVEQLATQQEDVHEPASGGQRPAHPEAGPPETATAQSSRA